VLAGLKANWVARGADPAVLDKLVALIRGYVVTERETE